MHSVRQIERAAVWGLHIIIEHPGHEILMPIAHHLVRSEIHLTVHGLPAGSAD